MSLPAEVHVVAGPNGSGKSTYVSRWDRRFPIFDPDAIAKEAPGKGGNELIYSGRQLHAFVNKMIGANTTFGIETTLSGKTVIRMVEACRSAGFKFILHFVFVEGLFIARARVAHRVAIGGHGVPEHDQSRRFERSLRNAKSLVRLADVSYVIDNSARSGHRLVAQFESGEALFLAPDAPDWLLPETAP